MPLLKFHVIEGRKPEELELLLDATHEIMVRSFGVPERDRYQTVSEYKPTHMQILDTGLNIPRTEKFVLVEIISRPRAKEAKMAFYANLTAVLKSRCEISPSDVMITFIENNDEDWSFGSGRAQFLTGEL
ncbi:tautomerase family protein [Rhizobium sp. LEGMi135b]